MEPPHFHGRARHNRRASLPCETPPGLSAGKKPLSTAPSRCALIRSIGRSCTSCISGVAYRPARLPTVRKTFEPSNKYQTSDYHYDLPPLVATPNEALRLQPDTPRGYSQGLFLSLFFFNIPDKSDTPTGSACYVLRVTCYVLRNIITICL